MTTLDLTNTKLGDDGAVLIATALRSNGALETLRLERNRITPRGIRELTAALKMNSSLSGWGLKVARPLSSNHPSFRLAMSALSPAVFTVRCRGWAMFSCLHW